jgi:transcriptional regulator with XRE-family HTH domain
MARHSSYNPDLHPAVAEAKKRDGWTDEQVADHLGISLATLKRWKKEFEPFRAAFEKGRDFVDLQVENALLKRALGYEYEEVETEIIDTGKGQRKKVRKVTKRQAPDVGAQIFWLKNRKPKEWRERPEEASPRARGEGLLAEFMAVIQSTVATETAAANAPAEGDHGDSLPPDDESHPVD